MLMFSSAIILYGSLYRGDEVKRLLTLPVRPERIVLHKFEEAVFFSGWGLVLLGSPMLLAHGLVFHAPWYYYLLLFPFILTFVCVPATLGAIVCLLVVRLLPAARVHAMALFAVVGLMAGCYLAWQALAYDNRDVMSFTWFHDVLARLEFAEQRLLPSWWLSSGLLEATHPARSRPGAPAWQESLLFLGVLCSNTLVLHWLLRWIAATSFRTSYSQLQGIVPARRRHHTAPIDRLVVALCQPLPSAIRHMIVKDLRIFRRDPVQWSQFAIFSGLLVLYFLNIRRFDYSGVMEQWVTVMSFLNVAVVGLLLSTFTTRFIFPSISLEGRRFWILGTSPIARDSIVWGKFWFALAGAWPPSVLLVVISDFALGVVGRSPFIVAMHQLECAVLCIGLSALAVGIGARLPNLRETSPARIASGFGGTLNLVVSTLYILSVMLVSAVPTFFWADSPWSAKGSSPTNFLFGGWIGLGSHGSMVVGLVLTIALGVVATAWPLRSGLRAFRRLEY
jgi:ABC-2 type transport system permease protein